MNRILKQALMIGTNKKRKLHSGGVKKIFLKNTNLLLTEREGRTGEYWPEVVTCLLYTSPSPRDQRGSRMPSSA